MNVERLKMLRDHIANIPESEFNMADYEVEGDCGTVRCIAGHCKLLFHDVIPDLVWWNTEASSREVLGLTWNQGHRLFLGAISARLTYGVTRNEALQTLDHLMATGKVDWSHAIKGRLIEFELDLRRMSDDG